MKVIFATRVLLPEGEFAAGEQDLTESCSGSIAALAQQDPRLVQVLDAAPVTPSTMPTAEQVAEALEVLHEVTHTEEEK